MTTTTTDSARFTDLTIVGTHDDVLALADVIDRAGVLVHRTAPKPAAPDDPRLRVTFRLHLHHR
jgi:hypothetical protein